MADMNVQLKNAAGDLLFPKIKTSNVTNDAEFVTQTQLTAAINAAAHLKREIVAALPTENIDANTIYLVLKSPAGTNGDVYNEYLYINSAWELIGTTASDLSGYVSTSDLNTALALKANLASPELTGAPTCPTPTTDSGIANKSYVDTAAAGAPGTVRYDVLT